MSFRTHARRITRRHDNRTVLVIDDAGSSDHRLSLKFRSFEDTGVDQATGFRKPSRPGGDFRCSVRPVAGHPNRAACLSWPGGDERPVDTLDCTVFIEELVLAQVGRAERFDDLVAII